MHHCSSDVIGFLDEAAVLAFPLGFEVVLVSLAPTIDEPLALSGLPVEEESSESGLAWTHFSLEVADFPGKGLESSTFVVALLFSFEVVPVSSASSVNELQTLAGLLVIVVSGHVGSAYSGFGSFVAVWAVKSGLSVWALIGPDAFSVGTSDESILAFASDLAHEVAEFGWVVVVLASQGAGSSASIVTFILAADLSGSVSAFAFAFLFSREVVFVATASAVDELLALTGFFVEIISGEVASAQTGFGWQGAPVRVSFEGAGAFLQALLLCNVSVSVALATAIDELLAISCIFIVVPHGEVTSAHTGFRLVNTVLFFSGASFGLHAFAIFGLDVSFIAEATRNAHQDARSRRVFVVVTGKRAGGAALFIVRVKRTILSGGESSSNEDKQH